MAEVKYQYAYDENDNLISIRDVTEENRKGHTYKCIGCGNELLPRAVSSKRVRSHFYHKESVNCSGETYLHKLTKRFIKNRFDKSNEFKISHLTTRVCNRKDCQLRNRNCQQDNIEQIIDLKKDYNTCLEEHEINGFIADLLLINNQDEKIPPILIEVCVTHPCEDIKRNSGLKIIEIQVKDESDLNAIFSNNILQENIRSLEKQLQVEFISFPKQLLVPLSNNFISRFIFDPLSDDGGYLTNLDCSLANIKVAGQSTIELNIIALKEGAFNRCNIYIPFMWLAKNKGIKNCELCKFHYSKIDIKPPICQFLSEQDGSPRFPPTKSAETCLHYEMARSYIHFYDEEYKLYAFNEVDELKTDKFMVVVDCSEHFGDYDLLKRKCTHWLSKQLERNKVVLLADASRSKISLLQSLSKELQISLQLFFPDSSRYGVKAQAQLQEDMLSEADALIAFWDGVNKYTGYLVHAAKSHKIKSRVYNYKTNEYINIDSL